MKKKEDEKIVLSDRSTPHSRKLREIINMYIESIEDMPPEALCSACNQMDYLNLLYLCREIIKYI